MTAAKTVQRLARLFVIALVATALGMVGKSVQHVRAADPDCVDYACDSDEACERVECDICFTHDRCADLPQ